MRALDIAVGLGLFVIPLQATDRYFRDLEAASPNSRFRAEAKSPDNVGGPWKKAFQDHFVYRLREEGKRGEVWSRNQPMPAEGRLPREGPPVALYLNDEGWLVIRTAEVWNLPCELVAVDPMGQDRLRVEILKTLLPDMTSLFKHTAHSTGGVLWGEQYCRPYFVALRGQPHFCLTTWWGQRLLLDLSAGRVVTDSSEFEPELRKAEKGFVLATLEATALWNYDLENKFFPGLATNSPGPSVTDVLAATFLAARLNIPEAVPFVRKLESSPIVLTSVGGPSSYQAPANGIKPASYQNLTMRQTAQLCLRRLGVRPSTHQSTKLYRDGGYWQPEDPLPFQREQRVEELKTGMTPEEVTALIGTPDFITHDGWEYDVDGKAPATLILRWGQRGVEKLEHQTPPKWSNGVERDRQLIL